MRQSLAEAAVSGTSNRLSDEKRKLLEAGDTEGLLALNRSLYGGFTMMADEDDDADDDADQTDDDDADDGDDEDAEDDSDDSKKVDAKDRRIQELSAESARHRKRASQRGRRIAELERENAELKKGKGKKATEDSDADGDDSEEANELKATNEKLARTNEDLLIRLEFMGNTKHSWKNPKAALRLLDLSDVEITEDGEVEGLDEAIEALAKSDPYLLKGKDDEDDDDEDKPRRRRTGQPPSSKRTKGNPNRDKLVAKYPALRR